VAELTASRFVKTPTPWPELETGPVTGKKQFLLPQQVAGEFWLIRLTARNFDSNRQFYLKNLVFKFSDACQEIQFPAGNS
jgi:hypothetical protein